MTKYTFKITKTNNQTTTIVVYAYDSQSAFDQVDRIISDIKSFEIVSVEAK